MTTRPHHLLFVCTGNICRSPMAEYLAVHHAQKTGVDLLAKSAGTLGLTNRSADPKMIAVGAELDLDLDPHVCQPITDELVDWADSIYVMEYQHYGHLAELHLSSEGKVYMLGTHDGVDEIDDPIGAWTKWRFRKCRDQIHRCVKAVVDVLPSDFDTDMSTC